MSERDTETVTVVVGCVDPLGGRGLVDVLREDCHVEILASGLDDDELERVVAERSPRVAVLGESGEDSLLVRLKSCKPAPGVLVLAHDPPRLYGTLLRTAGATCLARGAATATS